jgi:hypothetical protein
VVYVIYVCRQLTSSRLESTRWPWCHRLILTSWSRPCSSLRYTSYVRTVCDFNFIFSVRWVADLIFKLRFRIFLIFRNWRFSEISKLVVHGQNTTGIWINVGTNEIIFGAPNACTKLRKEWVVSSRVSKRNRAG